MYITHSFFVFLIAVMLSVTAHAEPEQKYRQLQAAWIYNIARFIEYPQEQQHFPLNICVTGNEASVITEYLQKGVSGRLVQRRPISVIHLSSSPQQQQCHLIYLTAGASLKPEVSTDITQAYLISGPEYKSTSVSLFSLRLNGNKLELYLNKAVLQQTNAKISPSLLKLARPLEVSQ